MLDILIRIVSMKRCITLLLVFFQIIFFSSANANEFCNGENQNSKLFSSNIVDFIEIEIPKNRSWVKNYFGALKTSENTFNNKYKKKFKANINIKFDNNVICQFPARVRINGDFKDHLAAIGTPSLDASLKKGNVNSSVKFKLLLPQTRNGDSEVIITTILRNLGFISPKTYYVNSSVNGIPVKYLFQEKITKELIEMNKYREAPILKADEKFFFHESGNQFKELVTAKIVNKNWIEKNEVNLNIARDALAKLNLANMFFNLNLISNKEFDHNFNSRFFFPNIFNKTDSFGIDGEYKALLLAMEAGHGLERHNRVFYFDPMKNNFLPIYYDGNSKVGSYRSSINNLYHELIKRDFLPGLKNVSRDEVIGANSALKKITKINKNILKSEINSSGVNISLEEIDNVIKRIIVNLETIRDSDRIIDISTKYDKYFSMMNRDQTKFLVFSESENLLLAEFCDFWLENCEKKEIRKKHLSKLLTGKVKTEDGIDYIYLGSKKAYLSGEILDLRKNSSVKDLGNGAILKIFGEGDYFLAKDRKILFLYQTTPETRFLIVGGKINDLEIKLEASKKFSQKGKSRHDQNLITGCLTFRDVKFNNLKIYAKNSHCEDSVNFINSDGMIDNIIVQNASSDGVDADFSNIEFKNISIENTGNDCLDFSYGKYKITLAKLNSCGDKAISVGEKSIAQINNAQVINSNLAISAKDSSKVFISELKTKDIVSACFSAYKKKQEFWGGEIVYDKNNCRPDQISFDQYSSIIKKDEL